MAEFCLECWNKLTGTNDPPEKFHLSRDLDFCEECNHWKPVILAVRKRYVLREELEAWLCYLRSRRKSR